MQINWLTGCYAGIVSKLTLNFRVKRAAARSLRRQRRRGRLFVSTEPMESRLLLSVDTVSPTVLSINRTSPAASNTSASSVSFTATFSEPVSGVDATDFSVATTGTVASTPVQVSQVSDSVYTVTVSGITGTGSLGVNLADNDSIHDLAGNLLINPNAAASFANQATFATGTNPQSVTVGDVNADDKPDLIVANYSSNSVSVLLGNGNGTFKTQATFATARFRRHIRDRIENYGRSG